MKYSIIIIVIISVLACKSRDHAIGLAELESSAQAGPLLEKEAAISIEYGAGDVVTKGYLDSSGNMWFATTDEGIFKFDGTTFTRYTVEDGLCGGDVWDILEDDDGMMWFGTANGLCKFNGDYFETIPIPKDTTKSDWLSSVYPVVNPNGVASLIQDRSGDYWIGSNGAGAYRYDGTEFESYLKEVGNLMPDSLYHNAIFSIVEDSHGDLWLGSFSHGGVSQYDGSRFIHHALKDGFGDGMISSLLIDKKDHLWVGTRNGGIYRYDGDAFVNIKEEQTNEQIAMATFLEDSTGKIWAASYARKGIYTFNGASFSPWQMKNSDKLVDIKSISEDKNGHIWFGGRHGILWRFDGEELKDFTYEKRRG